jgi:hypothetical protein
MKIRNLFIAYLVALTLTTALGQSSPTNAQRVRTAEAAQRVTPADASAAKQSATDTSQLTKFDLDFPGGTPKELVAAIQKARSKPLNAIIPEEHAGFILPPLKMNNVTVPQLFTALERASTKDVAYVTGTQRGGYGAFGGTSYQFANTSYGFSTFDGNVTDDSIWYFRVNNAPKPPSSITPDKACRFYSLTPYLDHGLKVDDITTAIQTGWKMMGDKDTPTISFHKDTKLLIAVGEPSKLETIDAVLKALEPPKPKPAPAPQPKPAGKSGEASKADE